MLDKLRSSKITIPEAKNGLLKNKKREIRNQVIRFSFFLISFS